MLSLQNQLLIAMPTLNDSIFKRSLIYICEHDHTGAMGIIINRPAGIDIGALLEQMELTDPSPTFADIPKNQVLIGGPVTPDRGFVLHSPQPFWTTSQSLNEELMLTTSRDILASLGSDKAPANYLVALGYAGWAKDQLEQELADNAWLTVAATPELLFTTEHQDRWQIAMQSLGFDVWQMSSQTGHA
ncbi:YqgE/AlgH family protein [Shewanella sp. NIFS-20-20]|uniref:YqgE/AlgH family protein n=1 Tax=Shewanella sp. NIFS-20-20 TaxID=2853806 RepID=UPI001C482020|nr:YqgE/AlgH family protein [Shewanella sp. NIFS-20-20]MBV7316614.1 YqgE/AlgH family protein [Shewanella sp. NIFS-20-20]